MHLLTTSSTGLDEIIEAIDLGQPPGEIAILSFADSDLAGLSAAWAAERTALPSLRLAHLRDLRHPMSVDLWIDRVGKNAKIIVVRLLGGLDWWRYGVERLAAIARERGSVLAVLPGEDRDDPRLDAASTLPSDELRALLQYFREGGIANLRAIPGVRWKRMNPPRCRGLPPICRGKVRSRWGSCASASQQTARSCRSSSIARCCSPETRPRLMLYAPH
jgi:cobaltochelatase CobN